MPKGLENALDECLARIEEGESLEDCLQRFPQYRDELRPLLRTALVIDRAFEQSVQESAPPEKALARARTRFMAEVSRRDHGENSEGDDSLWDRWFGWIPDLFRSRGLHTVAITLLLLIALLGGSTMASANSLPGDALYGVKRASEQVRLFLTLGEETRTELQRQYEERRVKEVKEVTQKGRKVEVTFEGAVESVQDDTIVVSGIPVRLSSDADEARPSVGTKVQVAAETQDDGSVKAKALRVETQEPAAEGTDSPNARPTFTPVRATPKPTFTPQPTPTNTSLPPTPTEAPTEMPTEVETEEAMATVVDTETPVETATQASTITPLPTDTPPPTATNTPLPPPDEVKIRIEGVIEDIGDSHWTVAGTRFELGSVVLINQERAQAQVGGWATVDAVKKPDGRIIARSIRVLHGPDEPPQDKEFRGVIESWGGEAWVIAGQRVLITSDTIIEGTPKVGAIARVKAEQYADGRLVAKGITVESEPEQQVVQFEGIIQELPPSAPHSLNGNWIVEADGERVTVRVTGNTEIDGKPEVGLTVEVEGTWMNDGSVRAESIAVDDS